MQKKYWGIIIAICLLGDSLLGQSVDTVLAISEVQIVASKDRYMVGSKIETIDSKELEVVSGESLAGVICNYLPIYIKQDAGGLATIHFRGTSPDHTAIMFNGININSLTLGHTNISNISAFLFDEVKVQFGGASSLYGTDAIGGSIHLNNNPKWNKGFNVGLQQDFASFGSQFSGLKMDYSTKRFKYSIKLYRLEKDNDFPFLNTSVKDFETNTFVFDTTKNASINNKGVLQEIDYKISDNLFSYVKVWYEDNWHQIQPNMSANYYGGSFDEIENRHLRTVAGLKYFKGYHKLTTDVGYVHDYQLFNMDDDQIISTNSSIVNLNYYNSNILKGNFNTGVNYSHIVPEVHAYEGDITEDRADIFSSYKKTLFQGFSGSLNIRESLVSNFESQFAPSIGFNYLQINTENNKLDYKISVSKSYKTPSFNDRFWYPNGNPDLLPEKGMNYEISSIYKIKKKTSASKFSITCYYMEVDNWIQWINIDMWRPRNIKKVKNRGVEVSLNNSFKISKIEFNTGVNYSLTKATEVKSYEDYSSLDGKQLIYTPMHIGRAILSMKYKKWNFFTTSSYTGERYNQSFKVLEDYFLINMTLGKDIDLKYINIAFNLKINNVLNQAYQNQELFAMPGRNYAISIKFLFNNLKLK